MTKSVVLLKEPSGCGVRSEGPSSGAQTGDKLQMFYLLLHFLERKLRFFAEFGQGCDLYPGAN